MVVDGSLMDLKKKGEKMMQVAESKNQLWEASQWSNI